MSCLFNIKSCFSKSKKTLTNYVPNDATEQNIFLTTYPEFDGKEIKIAIIDSGIDVSLNGLQKTSNGLPKIVDCFDFTGAGDVDTTVIKEMDSNNILIGLSGRKFKIPKKWVNPSGKWHIGLKSLYKPAPLGFQTFYRPTPPPSTFKKLPEIDCIVWFDGIKWLACIDTCKSLDKATVLTNFRDKHEYGILSNDIVYSITIHNDGKLLEICMAYDDHGSAIAQIAAAYFEGKPEQNGLAPGSQIISMNVMNPGKGSVLCMESLKKALLKCIEMKVDIVNYSIEHFTGDEGISKLIIEMVNNHNILIFKSAGNRGPLYATTLSYDHSIENAIFRIGALLTHEMRKRIYYVQGSNEEEEEQCSYAVYPSSSRGPGALGSRGLDFVAPGAIITNIPHFYSHENIRYEGTSFSAPNAAGAVACLLSALKANSIEYTPLTIKFALYKTAFLPKDRSKLEFGHGIIRNNEAFNYCKKNNILDFKIPTTKTVAKGICILQNDENQNVIKQDIDLSHFIDITPEEAATSNWSLKLSSNAKSYIELSTTKIPKNHLLSIKVDTEKLEPGISNFAEIMIMDPLIGAIFSIPINVIYLLKITETRNYCIKKEITLIYENPYHILFHPFFEKRKNCQIVINSLNAEETNLCMEYVVYDENRWKSIEAGDTRIAFGFNAKNQTKTYVISIEKSEIHEICIYQKPGALSKANFELDFNFIDDDTVMENINGDTAKNIIQK